MATPSHCKAPFQLCGPRLAVGSSSDRWVWPACVHTGLRLCAFVCLSLSHLCTGCFALMNVRMFICRHSVCVFQGLHYGNRVVCWHVMWVCMCICTSLWVSKHPFCSLCVHQ